MRNKTYKIESKIKEIDNAEFDFLRDNMSITGFGEFRGVKNDKTTAHVYIYETKYIIDIDGSFYEIDVLSILADLIDIKLGEKLLLEDNDNSVMH